MRRLGLVLIVVLLAAPASLAAPAVPAGFSVDQQRPLHAGAEYLTLSRGGGSPAVAHVAHLAPGALVELRTVSAKDRITRHEDDRERPSSMCARVNCMIAINGDFWDYGGATPWPQQPQGGMVSRGRMLRTPTAGFPQVTVTSDGRLQAGILAWSAQAVAPSGAPISLAGINRPDPNGVVLFTPMWGKTDAGDGVELVLEGGESLGAINRTVTVEAVELRPQGGPVPAGGAVLTGVGAGETALNTLWAGLAGGDRRLSVTVTSPVAARESLGSHPQLLSGGQKVFPDASDSFVAGRHPRTVLGWNGAGDVFFVTVDDGSSDSEGMSLNDAADLLLGLGATDAVNFDGGGGTTFVVDGEVVNRPEEGNERDSVNAFVAVRGVADDEFVPPPPDPGGGGGGGGPGPTPIPPAVTPRSGYRMVAADGAVYAFGDARHLGNAPVSGASAVDLEPTRSGNGYWIVDDAGHVFGFGDARWLGNADPTRLVAGEKVTSLSATPTGNGYWFFTSRGRVLAMGDAVHAGDVSAIALNGPVLDSIPTPSGRGYYMVASDGGIFTFGDAVFRGSTGSIKLNAPVQSLVPDPDGLGYWLVASDGGVFSFDGAFRGSLGSQRLNKPVTGMVPYGNGYLMVAEDGGIFNFSDKAFAGSLGSTPPARPVVSVAALR